MLGINASCDEWNPQQTPAQHPAHQPETKIAQVNAEETAQQGGQRRDLSTVDELPRTDAGQILRSERSGCQRDEPFHSNWG
jgi:hypothetical protein